MSVYKELSFENDIDEIKAIQFSVMSPEEIRQKSVAEITSTDTYSNNEPIIGGLFDSRMGVIENDKICKTCEQKNTFCPGHFGHIELARPVFNIQFFDMIRKILKCICFRCSALLLDPNSKEISKLTNKKISRQKRFDVIYKCCSKVKRCGNDNHNGCGAKQPNKLTKENIGKIYMEWSNLDEDTADVKKLEFSANDVLLMLKRINNEDASVLGFSATNRPEWMICVVFPVPPPSVRPSVRNDTGQRCEDDLTHKLCDIIKTNKTLKQKVDKNLHDDQIDYWTMLVQYHILTFVDNKLPGVAQAKQRTGRPLKSLTERLKSKEGRIRGNLMGKRVDFSARSVITPDPNIGIDELGVPIKIAMNLTFPETVNKFNIDKLREYVKNGQNTYPGAKYVRKCDEGFRCIRLKLIDNIQHIVDNLKINDIVDRHLINGDYVLFNRQPSLHKMSMMSHKVRIMDYDTFRLNVCCTPSYNADYDGDEMNMHVPQSLQTENELIELASVPTQIISPRNSSPIISIVQDIALGVYKLTGDNVFITNKQMFNLLASNDRFHGEILKHSKMDGKVPYWSGKTLLSSVIPPTISLKNSDVIIKNGVIKSGTVSKKTYQDMTNGIIHISYNDIGKETTQSIFDNTQKMICDWLVLNGFSVGISDLTTPKHSKDKLKNILNDMTLGVDDLMTTVHNNTFKNDSIKSNHDYFEEKMSNLLDKANKEICNVVLENADNPDNRMMNMINSKSKGNAINISQMMGSVGQQSIEGKRIVNGFDNRTLPHYTKYDDSPESKGFVKNSFITGLNPQEFFFHAMGGREGLIDTAVKTSETGYIQRKLVKAMEDCKVNFDMTVRNAHGTIIQFLYGDDGMNSIKLEKQKISYLMQDSIIKSSVFEDDKTLRFELDNEKMTYYNIQKKDINKLVKQASTESEIKYEKIKNILTLVIRNNKSETLQDIQTRLTSYFEIQGVDRITKEHLITNVDNFKYILTDDILKEFQNDETKNEKCNEFHTQLLKDREYLITNLFDNKPDDTVIYPIHFERQIQNVITTFGLNNTTDASDLNPLYVLQKIKECEKYYESFIIHKNGTNILNILMRCFLSPKVLLKKYKLTKVAFDFLLEKIKVCLCQSIAQPSEMVGVVAAQSIGEPTTQLTLNTFHLSGVASASKAVRGVPRIKELLSISKNIKAPSCKIYLKEHISMDDEKTKDAINAIENSYLRNIITKSEIYYEPNVNNSNISDDNKFLSVYNRFNAIISEENNDCDTVTSHWVLRLEIDRKALINHSISTHYIYYTLKFAYDDKIFCVYNDDNSDNIIFRIILADESIEDVITELKALEHDIIENLMIKGIPKINRVMCGKVNKFSYDYEECKIQKREENVLYTDGSNLKTILSMSKYIDATRTISNDIIEIYELFGIEAARQALYNEIDDILNENTSVNQRHISLLVDTMTCKGTLLSIDRHGINRSDIGPLAKCSFEETSDVIIKAGIFNECDRMNGVAANIMLGQIPNCGTGDSKIFMDPSKLSSLLTSHDEDDDDDDIVDDKYDDSDDDYCNEDNLTIEYSIPTPLSFNNFNINEKTKTDLIYKK